jgi:hypothetical protein
MMLMSKKAEIAIQALKRTLRRSDVEIGLGGKWQESEWEEGAMA